MILGVELRDDAITAVLTDGHGTIAKRAARTDAAAWLALNPVEREDYRRIGCLGAEIARAGIVRRRVWRLQPSHVEAQRRLPGGMANRVRVAATLGGDGGPLGAARAAMAVP